MKHLLFLGGMFPKNSAYVNENSKGNIQNAANVLQWGIINGLRESGEFQLSPASSVFVGAYPKLFKKLFVKEAEAIPGVAYIGFLNLPILKNISRYYQVKRYLKKWLRQNEGEELYIMAYSAHTPFIKAVSEIKKETGFHFHLIVPDLPMYMNLSNRVSIIYKIFKYIDIKVMNKALKAVDSFTFLTEAMSEAFNLYKKPYTVVEGMVNLETLASLKAEKDEQFTLVYTGTLEEKYGILNLVEAMDLVKSDVRLIICGKGDTERKVKEAALRNEKIIFKGIVSHGEALSLQGRASILVNPRPNNEEYTKYSFPSKNLEYMMWGKPVLVFKLDGIPEDYDDVFLYFNEAEPKDMARVIDEISLRKKEELDEIGRKTREFALTKKNHRSQTRKIIDCLLGEDGNVIDTKKI